MGVHVSLCFFCFDVGDYGHRSSSVFMLRSGEARGVGRWYNESKKRNGVMYQRYPH